MKIDFFCPRWGSEHLSWDVFLRRVQSAGYNGVEYAISADTSKAELDEVCNKAGKQGLLLIAQHYDTNFSDFRQHSHAYAAWFEKINGYPWVKINSQTGKDHFTEEQNTALIALAGEQVIHETHRGKFSFAAHITRKFLEKIPSLKLTFDVSHWVNVAESFLEDQADAVDLAIGRAEHIHARVGHPEGPQVPDPRVAEWHPALERHIEWWDKIVEIKKDNALSITCEFGPRPYMIHSPGDNEPLADQWEVNLYMMNLLKKRYA